MTTSDGGCIIVGNTNSFGAGTTDLWILKIHSSGDTLWTRTYGDIFYDGGYDIRHTKDGAYIAVGSYTSIDTGGYNGGYDLWLLKIGENAPSDLIVKDVPQDQGGQLQVSWKASGHDYNVTHLPYYSIWRAVPAISDTHAQIVSTPSSVPADFSGTAYLSNIDDTISYTWEWLSNQPALELPDYAYTASTLFDGIPSANDTSNALHYFMVVAHTADPNRFYLSKPVGGYSIDNLVPETPGGLRIAYNPDQQVCLNWNESTASDIFRYLVYHSTALFTDSSEADLLYVTPEVTCPLNDLSRELTHHFAVVAEDIHLNRSGLSSIFSLTPTAVGAESAQLPTEYALYPNYPNPFNPVTNIRYALPKESTVNLTVYNITGQEILSLVSTRQEAGFYTVPVDGTILPSGVYLYRLQTENYAAVRRMILMK